MGETEELRDRREGRFQLSVVRTYYLHPPKFILDLRRCRATAFNPSLHDKVGLVVIKNTQNSHVHSVFSCLLPAGPTILWEQLLLTLLVMLPVQPPLEGSEIKWSAESETLPLLVRQLNFTSINRSAGRFFPIFALLSFFPCASPAKQDVEDMQTTSVVQCPALVMENLFLKPPWPDLFCHTWNKVT